MKDIFDIQTEIVSKMVKEINDQKEKIVFDRLAELGHTFENDQERIMFISKRLERHIYTEYEEIVLDETISVARWNTSVEISQGYNDNHDYTVTATI